MKKPAKFVLLLVAITTVYIFMIGASPKQTHVYSNYSPKNRIITEEEKMALQEKVSREHRDGKNIPQVGEETIIHYADGSIFIMVKTK